MSHTDRRRDNAPLDLLHHAARFVAIDKPAGLAVIPGRGESTTVIEQAAAQLDMPCTGSADPRVRVVHRLDKDTSGVLLLALDSGAQRHFSHQFQNNTIAKEYLALVVGKPAEESGLIDEPIAPHPHNKLVMITTRHGRRAVTRWEVAERYRLYTLLRVFPQTGKTHQIRVHLRSVGLPLAIDPLYNPDRSGAKPGLFLSGFKRGYRPPTDRDERPLIDRLTLHAHRLAVDDLEGQRLTIESPPPKDMRALLNMLARHGR